MYGELTDHETIEQIESALADHQQDQFEILLYKKNREYFWFRSFVKLRFPSFSVKLGDFRYLHILGSGLNFTSWSGTIHKLRVA